MSLCAKQIGCGWNSNVAAPSSETRTVLSDCASFSDLNTNLKTASGTKRKNHADQRRRETTDHRPNAQRADAFAWRHRKVSRSISVFFVDYLAKSRSWNEHTGVPFKSCLQPEQIQVAALCCFRFQVCYGDTTKERASVCRSKTGRTSRRQMSKRIGGRAR